MLSLYSGQSFETKIQVVINLNHPLKQDLCCQYVRDCVCWKSPPLYPCNLQPLTHPSPPPLHPEAYAGYFCAFPSEFPDFPESWILSQIMLEGGLSRVGPLRSTALCRGSEVCETWCIRPRGLHKCSVFRWPSCSWGPKVHYSYIHTLTFIHQIGFLYCLNNHTSFFICFN